jgi:hypothetical protein
MTTFAKIEMIYDTDSDGITVDGYTVHTEVDKVDDFHKFSKHTEMREFIRKLNADLVIWPNGNITIKPNVFEMR